MKRFCFYGLAIRDLRHITALVVQALVADYHMLLRMMAHDPQISVRFRFFPLFTSSTRTWQS